MLRIKQVDPSKTTGETKLSLDKVQKKMGTVPNLMKVMANQPAVLNSYMAQGDALAQGSFDAKTREAIALTLAGENKCDYCASAHSAISKSLKQDQSEIDLHLRGRSSDEKLSTMLTFAKIVTQKRGLVSDDDIEIMRAAGFDDGAIVETVANVVANIFTNYINHLADTEIDFPEVRTANIG